MQWLPTTIRIKSKSPHYGRWDLHLLASVLFSELSLSHPPPTWFFSRPLAFFNVKNSVSPQSLAITCFFCFKHSFLDLGRWDPSYHLSISSVVTSLAKTSLTHQSKVASMRRHSLPLHFIVSNTSITTWHLLFYFPILTPHTRNQDPLKAGCLSGLPASRIVPDTE